MTRGMTTFWLPVAIVVFIGCVSAIPAVTSALVSSARRQSGGAVTVNQLERGREGYLERCGGCHHLHLPDSRPPPEWQAVFAGHRATLHDDEEGMETIELYVTAASAVALEAD